MGAPTTRRRRIALLVVEMVGVFYGASWILHELGASPFGPSTSASAAHADAPEGRWRPADLSGVPVIAPTPEAIAAEKRALEAIGYAAGSEAPSGPREGVIAHDPRRVESGWNLINSGDAGAAQLLDMEGHEVHAWSVPWDAAFPDLDPHQLVAEDADDPAGRQSWRRVALLPDGGLVAIYEGVGVVRVDVDSHVRWARRNGAHHDLSVADDGRIWLLTRKAVFRPDLRPGVVLEDFVTVLSPDGEEVDRFSLLEALRRSSFGHLLELVPMDSGDWLHTNTLQLLDGRGADEHGPAFAAGNLLVSWPNLDTVAVVDPKQRTVVWAMTGRWVFQHDPIVLPDGQIVVLDNRGAGNSSQLVQFDPATQAITRTWSGPPELRFSTRTCGAVQALANGDLLVTESDSGRAFEVAPDGGIVWAFVSPHRAGPRRELVATLFDVQRVPFSATRSWLHR